MSPDRHHSAAASGILCSVALAFALPTFSAYAVPPEPNVEVTPLIGYRSGGSFTDTNTGDDLNLDDSGSYGLVVNIDNDANTQWEFIYSHQETSMQLTQLFMGQSVFDLDIDYFSFGGSYVWRDPRYVPFIGAGLGVTHMSPSDSQLDSETRAMFQVGGGYKIFLTKNIGVRLEGRAYLTALESDAAVFCGNGACFARVESDGFSQFELSAGLIARF